MPLSTISGGKMNKGTFRAEINALIKLVMPQYSEFHL